MDCASEESEIRRALDGIAGIRALSFQLGQRTLAIDAPLPAIEQALAAIRKAGFDPQPVLDRLAPRQRLGRRADDHDHDTAPDRRVLAAGLAPCCWPSAPR